MRTFALSLVCALSVLAVCPAAHAERPLFAEGLPPELEGVGIVQRLDETLPLDLTFVDDKGKTVRLGDYFTPERPVILTLNYYRCPMLCTLTLNGLVDALNDVDWSAGAEFEIVTLSINPTEGPDLADVKKRAYLTQYRRESAAAGWHFLTGEQENIDGLADAVGYGYRFVPRTGEYAHPSSIVFITPDGRISRYMDDVRFDPKDVRLALVEASQGAIGSPIEKFLLFSCFRFDPDANSYVLSALKLAKAAGVLTVISMLGGWMYLVRRSPKTTTLVGGINP